MTTVQINYHSKVRFRFTNDQRGRSVTRIKVSNSTRVHVTRPSSATILVLVTNAVFVNAQLVLTVRIVESHIHIQTRLSRSRERTDPQGHVSRPIYPSGQVRRYYLVLNKRIPGSRRD